FPYIRAYISALTALSGLKTITIPTMNLTGLGEKLKRKTTFD
ncbi:MAG: protein export chaperone secb, partial [Flavobacteriales bacterium CG18_big_fil_WC_8_21_14_2_50_32_9]